MDTLGVVTGILAGGVISVALTWYAMRDVRLQLRNLVRLLRGMVYAEAIQRMMWQYVDPTDACQDSDIVTYMGYFNFLTQAIHPEYTVEANREVLVKDAVCTANNLVQAGHATWKSEVSLPAVQAAMTEWKNAKNKVRVQELLGEIKPIERGLPFFKT